MINKKFLAVGFALSIGSTVAFAAQLACNQSGSYVNVTEYYQAQNPGTTTVTGTIGYNSCVGVYPGNDVPGVAPGNALPTTNLGWYGDGYMNGEPNKQGSFFTGYEFTSAQYPASNLNGDNKPDPGWIYLGSLNFGDNGKGTFQAVSSIAGLPNTLFGSEIFSASYDTATGVGSWKFTPDKNIAIDAAPLFGKNYFDQFALVFKQGGGDKGGFAVYDFTSDQFGVAPPPSYLDPILNFEGDWNLTTVFNGQKSISHIALWARDPGGDQNVPEPGTLVLLGAALVGIAVARKRSVSAS